MKKLFIIILFAFLLTGYSNFKSVTKIEKSGNNVIPISTNENTSYNQNDLVYRDYGTGIKLSVNSTLTINSLDLNLTNDETAIIYAINLDQMEMIKLYDYHPNQVVLYTPASSGVYMIIAEIISGEIIDLTSKATIRTSYTEDYGGEFKFLE